MRIETDSIGFLEIPKNALYGINGLRASKNFHNTCPFPIAWYKAIAEVKLSYFITYKKFKVAVLKKHTNPKIKLIDDIIIEALITASSELVESKHFEHFVVPGISGAAGTSINLNICEIIANRALQITNHEPGNYKVIDPIEHVNVFQSTNDVIPTALKIAILKLLKTYELKMADLVKSFEAKEQEYKTTLRLAYTEYKEAVPSTYGRLFSTYSEAFSRDWWRISKCFERIKIVNLGGGAIGTGLTVPKFFIFETINTLKELTNLPISRADNMQDNTANLDAVVEVHSILKTSAINFEKVASDIRLLSSDISKPAFTIQKVQTGSSIMPNKSNPVISEYAISIAHQVYANDALIYSLSAQGSLDLNPYLPIIGKSFIETLELLISLSDIFKNLIEGIEIKDLDDIYKSPSISTALIPYLGYNKCTEIAQIMLNEKIDIYRACRKLNIFKKTLLKQILKPENLLSLGYNISEIEGFNEKS